MTLECDRMAALLRESLVNRSATRVPLIDDGADGAEAFPSRYPFSAHVAETLELQRGRVGLLPEDEVRNMLTEAVEAGGEHLQHVKAESKLLDRYVCDLVSMHLQLGERRDELVDAIAEVTLGSIRCFCQRNGVRPPANAIEMHAAWWRCEEAARLAHLALTVVPTATVRAVQRAVEEVVSGGGAIVKPVFVLAESTLRCLADDLAEMVREGRDDAIAAFESSFPQWESRAKRLLPRIRDLLEAEERVATVVSAVSEEGEEDHNGGDPDYCTRCSVLLGLERLEHAVSFARSVAASQTATSSTKLDLCWMAALALDFLPGGDGRAPRFSDTLLRSAEHFEEWLQLSDMCALDEGVPKDGFAVVSRIFVDEWMDRCFSDASAVSRVDAPDEELYRMLLAESKSMSHCTMFGAVALVRHFWTHDEHDELKLKGMLEKEINLGAFGDACVRMFEEDREELSTDDLLQFAQYAGALDGSQGAVSRLADVATIRSLVRRTMACGAAVIRAASGGGLDATGKTMAAMVARWCAVNTDVRRHARLQSYLSQSDVAKGQWQTWIATNLPWAVWGDDDHFMLEDVWQPRLLLSAATTVPRALGVAANASAASNKLGVTASGFFVDEYRRVQALRALPDVAEWLRFCRGAAGAARAVDNVACSVAIAVERAVPRPLDQTRLLESFDRAVACVPLFVPSSEAAHWTRHTLFSEVGEVRSAEHPLLVVLDGLVATWHTLADLVKVPSRESACPLAYVSPFHARMPTWEDMAPILLRRGLVGTDAFLVSDRYLLETLLRELVRTRLEECGGRLAFDAFRTSIVMRASRRADAAGVVDRFVRQQAELPPEVAQSIVGELRAARQNGRTRVAAAAQCEEWLRVITRFLTRGGGNEALREHAELQAVRIGTYATENNIVQAEAELQSPSVANATLAEIAAVLEVVRRCVAIDVAVEADGEVGVGGVGARRHEV